MGDCVTAPDNISIAQPGRIGGSAAPPDGDPVRRVGVVDVGSNSVRLVVFDGVARSPAYFYNEKILCGLGKGLRETGRLNPEGRSRALNALYRFTALAQVMQVSTMTGVATAAVREATDGLAFRDQVAASTGLKLHIASGAEEALLSAKGVLLGWPQANGLVCDIGGASMELARIDNGRPGARATSPLGPLVLSDLGGDAEIDAYVDAELDKLTGSVNGKGQRIYLVGGSWRAIARLDMDRRDYPLKVLHEYEMTPEHAVETCRWLSGQTLDDLVKISDSSKERLELVPLAARVLRRLVQRLDPRGLTVSSYGLREGLLYERMPSSMQARDPLLEAARHMERASARFPGFGASLHAWLSPLYPDADRAELRLMRAACYLHDITWRAHPDYRADVCFETVTRANLSGLDHPERVFLGVAIMNRYKSSSAGGFDPAILNLLSPERQAEAERLGRAIRLGAMLSGSAPGTLENTELAKIGGELVLTLRGPARALRGEMVQKRLDALANRLNLTPRVALKPA